MPEHHTEDYKLAAVNYYLQNDTSYANACNILTIAKEV